MFLGRPYLLRASQLCNVSFKIDTSYLFATSSAPALSPPLSVWINIYTVSLPNTRYSQCAEKLFQQKKMPRKTSMQPFSVTFFFSFFFCLVSLCNLSLPAEALNSADESNIAGGAVAPPVVTKGQRKSLVVTEYGEISAIDLEDETKGRPYHMQFFTLEPNSLFLPALLHADMVLYVHTGCSRSVWLSTCISDPCC